jgi:hypothetical protein
MKKLKKIYLFLKRNKSLDDLVWLYNHTGSKKMKKIFYEKAIKEYSLSAPECKDKEEAKENMLLFIRKAVNLVRLSSKEVAAGYWGRKTESFL